KTPVSMLETSDAKLREDLIQRLVDFKVMGPVGQMVLCNDPSTLPMKELPHGSVSNLFLMYLAYANILGERPASRATFYREAKKWRCCMRFHKVTVHSICTTCARLKMKIREASDFVDHAKWCDALLGHYTSSWRDREVYWLARARSRGQGDLITMIIDSYDRQKLLLPKYPYSRTPKGTTYESIRRTGLMLTASLVHGWGAYIFISDEGMPCGANWTLELAMRSIDFAFAKARRDGKTFPHETAGQSRDVYALVKAKMSDRHLSQLPLLIYPEALLPSTERFWNSINTASKTLTQSLDSERMDELRKLRSQFLQDFPHLSRAARYYQQLMDENRPRQPYKQLEFIRAGPTAAGRVGHFELGVIHKLCLEPYASSSDSRPILTLEWSTELEEPEVRLMLESIPLHILQGDHYVPGSSSRCDSQQFQNKPPVFKEILQVRSSEDHLVVLWINLPTAGIVGAAKDDFFISLITNILTKYKRNSIALVVHANRAETKEGSPGAKSEPDAAKSEVKDEDTPMKGEESDDGSDENENDKERPADSDVRDVRYQLEIPALVQQFVLGSSGGSLKLSGFPDFTGLVEAIQKGQASQVPKAYNVCVMKGESLRILKSLAQKFLDHELTHDKALGVIEDHNKKHNCDSDYLEPDAAPLVLQNSPNKLLLLSLHYIALTLLPETHTVEQRNEAPEEDLERAPKRIKLEPTDTVNISISHHTITTEDRCPTPTSKPLVFVLDDPKDPEDKKAKKPKKGKKGKEGKDALTAKNFGSRVDTSKFKQGSKLILAWRVRLDVSEGANIVPIRPIAVLSGTLDLQQTTIRLL
ncbi:unnamed protein product, partial [Durusdinium trenchii]